MLDENSEAQMKRSLHGLLERLLKPLGAARSPNLDEPGSRQSLHTLAHSPEERFGPLRLLRPAHPGEGVRKRYALGPMKDPSRWLVVDTNQLMQDFTLSSPLSLKFLLAARFADTAPCLPAPVIAEAKNKHAREMEKLTRDFRQASERLFGMTAPSFEERFPEAKQRDSTFYRYSLVRFHPYLTDYPSVPHDVIVSRIHAAQKPFGGNSERADVGYRDFLIWCCVLELLLASPSSSVLFVTDNHRDFLADGGSEVPALHPDLLRDLEDYGIQPARVRCHRSRKDCLSDIIRQLPGGTRRFLDADPAWLPRLESDWAPRAIDAHLNAISATSHYEHGQRFYTIDRTLFYPDSVTLKAGGFLLAGSVEFNPCWHYGDGRPVCDNSDKCSLNIEFGPDLLPRAFWVDDHRVEAAALAPSRLPQEAPTASHTARPFST